VIPVLIAKHIAPDFPFFAVMVGLAAIIGHNWSVFLMGSGGKGVATSAGVFLALLPKQCIIAIIMFCGLFYWTGFVSVGSIGAALTLMLATFVFKTPVLYRFIVFLAGIMLIIKHIPNLKRLARGEEPKVNFR
jgi:glycerol-3-phosphate acyltransferase PlsY